MMKLLRCSSSSSSNSFSFLSKFIKVFAYPARTLATKATTEATKDSLYNRLVAISDHKASIIPILDGWINEEREIDQQDLQKLIKQFRKYTRYKHALEISEWMINSKYLGESPKHLAVQLDLVSKVHGIKQAEKYFNEIPEPSRVSQVYGALLNCYVTAKSIEKAETIMQKLKEMGSDTPLAYNVMLKLYSQTEDYNKFDSLVEEMDNKGDIITLNIRLNAYAASSDISKMENLLRKMQADPKINISWNAYANAANGYLKAGFREKSLEMLKKSEQLVNVNSGKFAYEILMSIYATTGNKDDVYRIWKLYKKMRKIYNTTYLCMMCSLEKLDDLDGAEKILEEWEEKKTYFDIRLPNFLITAYCKKGFFGKAEMVIKRLVESGNNPNASTWNRMALGYLLNNRMEEMVETMKKVILSSQVFWKPDLAILSSCLEYLKEQGEVEKLEEIKRLLEEKGHNYADICEKIAKYHEKIGKIDNESYLYMMSSLGKLGDLDGMEKIFEKWEEKKKSFDFRIPNFLITAYCKKGFLEKAEMVIKRLVESGNNPNGSTWYRMALGYLLNNRMEEMVETMKKVILSSQVFSKPNLAILSSCLEYLKEQGEVEKLEEIKRLLEEKGHNYADICEKIAKYHENKSEKSENVVQIDGEEEEEDNDQDSKLEVREV